MAILYTSEPQRGEVFREAFARDMPEIDGTPVPGRINRERGY